MIRLNLRLKANKHLLAEEEARKGKRDLSWRAKELRKKGKIFVTNVMTSQFRGGYYRLHNNEVTCKQVHLLHFWSWPSIVLARLTHFYY